MVFLSFSIPCSSALLFCFVSVWASENLVFSLDLMCWCSRYLSIPVVFISGITTPQISCLDESHLQSDSPIIVALHYDLCLKGSPFQKLPCSGRIRRKFRSIHYPSHPQPQRTTTCDSLALRGQPGLSPVVSVTW